MQGPVTHLEVVVHALKHSLLSFIYIKNRVTSGLQLRILFFPPVSMMLLGAHITASFDLDSLYELIVIFYSRSLKNYISGRVQRSNVYVLLQTTNTRFCCLTFHWVWGLRGKLNYWGKLNCAFSVTELSNCCVITNLATEC